MDIESILAGAELPETSATLCLRGSLVAEYERLDEHLKAAGSALSLAGDESSSATVARMEELREQMLAAEVTFRFRALPGRRFSDYRARMPEKADGQSADEYADLFHGWTCGLVAACAVEPEMSAEQAGQLSERLSNAQWARLSNAAWLVNSETQKIPFSDAAFVASLTSAAKSKRQPEPESAAVGSLAGSPDPSPSTSTETTDA